MALTQCFVLLALALLSAGCLCLYLASPHQSWLSKPWQTWPAVLAGSAWLVLGFAALLQVMRPVTASFFAATTVMLVFPLIVYLGAWRRSRRQEGE